VALQVMVIQGVPPVLTPEVEPFWAGTARGELLVEQCHSCGLHIFPPRGVCRACYGRNLTWVRVESPGVLYSYTINQNPWTPDLEAVYGIGLVEFPQYSGVRFVGFLDGFASEPEIGSLVDIEFIESVHGFHRPCFVPSTAQ